MIRWFVARQLARRRAPAPGEVGHHAAGVEVVPAADLEHRDREAREMLVDRGGAPVVVVVVVIEPGREGGVALAGDLVHRPQRQRAQDRRPVEVVDPLHGAAHRPPAPDGVDAEAEGAALVVRAVPEVVAHHPRHDRLQERVAGEGGLPLHLAEVGAAGHADVAVAPRLLADPLQRVVAVVRLVVPGHELALGVVPAAHVLRDVDVAVLRPEEAEVHQQVVVVRRARQEHRPRAVAVAGQIDVGREADAVPHRHRQIVLVADAGGAEDGHETPLPRWSVGRAGSIAKSLGARLASVAPPRPRPDATRMTAATNP